MMICKEIGIMLGWIRLGASKILSFFGKQAFHTTWKKGRYKGEKNNEENIRENTGKFSPNAGKYGLEKLFTY